MAEKKKKTMPKKAKSNSANKPRARKLNRKQKKTVKKSNKVPGGYSLLTSSLKHLWKYKRLFLGLFLVYVVLYFVFVKGLAANFQLSDTKDLLDTTYGSELSAPEKASTLFGTLIGSASTVSSESASIYQAILYIVFSLAIIWALRQTFEGKTVGIKQSIYSSVHPLVTYVLIYLLMLLQLIPMLVGVGIYSIVASNGIAVGFLEQFLLLIFMMATVIVSLYFVMKSFFATYIVTLSGMYPMEALKLSKKLIQYRRLLIARRFMFFVFVIIMFMIVVFLPLVFLLPTVAEVSFLILSLFLLFVFHAYFYSLYRELM